MHFVQWMAHLYIDTLRVISSIAAGPEAFFDLTITMTTLQISSIK